MRLTAAAALVLIALLSACGPAATGFPISSPSPSATAASPSVSPSESPSPTTPADALPTSYAPTEDLLTGGAKQIVSQMYEISGYRPALKLDVSASEVTLTVLTPGQRAESYRWQDGAISLVDSDLEYLDQQVFNPLTYPISDIDSMFTAASEAGADGKNQVLQIQQYSTGQVYLSVSTSPETKTVFFRKDGSEIKDLSTSRPTDIVNGLSEVMPTSGKVVAFGFDGNTGFWADRELPDGVMERLTRNGGLPPYISMREEGTTNVTFSPTESDFAAIAMRAESYQNRYEMDESCKVAASQPYGEEEPQVTYDCDGSVHLSTLDGTELETKGR